MKIGLIGVCSNPKLVLDKLKVIQGPTIIYTPRGPNMLMKSWAILGFDIPIVHFIHNISIKGCNYKFNNVFHGVWCVTKFGHHSMHIHLV
jgi:hypothetical protein